MGANKNVAARPLPLGDYGGTIQTHQVACGNPAINMGEPSNDSKDQRGKDVFGGIHDAESCELQTVCPGTSENFALTTLRRSNPTGAPAQ